MWIITAVTNRPKAIRPVSCDFRAATWVALPGALCKLFQIVDRTTKKDVVWGEMQFDRRNREEVPVVLAWVADHTGIVVDNLDFVTQGDWWTRQCDQP
jgi:hypothetical protein